MMKNGSTVGGYLMNFALMVFLSLFFVDQVLRLSVWQFSIRFCEYSFIFQREK